MGKEWQEKTNKKHRQAVTSEATIIKTEVPGISRGPCGTQVGAGEHLVPTFHRFLCDFADFADSCVVNAGDNFGDSSSPVRTFFRHLFQ